MSQIRSLKFITFCIAAYAILFLFSVFFQSSTTGQNFDNLYFFKLIVMFLIAEPHFAFTIPLLVGYKEQFTKRPVEFKFIPLIIIATGSILFFYSMTLFAFIFLFANIYHVNRQSLGFFKLQARASATLNATYEPLLHGFTLFFFLTRLIETNFSERLIFFGCFLIALIILGWFLFKEAKQDKWLKICSYTQGFMIFLPVAVFEDILLAFAIGIAIHYIQYMVISWLICRNSFNFPYYNLLLIVVLYATLTSSALGGFITQENQSLIIFIPTILQLLHFYFDGFLWRRDNEDVALVLKKGLA